jgi:hypothetical protein
LIDSMAMNALPAPEIPQSIGELTPAWLTAVLRSGGHLKAAQVVSVETETLGEGEGFIGQIVRLRLGLDREEPSAPSSVIAKFPIAVSQNRQLGEALGAYEREIRFYEELADRVPIAKPTCFYTAMDPNPFAGREKEALDFFDRLPRWLIRLLAPVGLWFANRSGRRYLLLLEDLAPSRRLGDQLAGCTAEEAEAVVREIVPVHLAWWGHDELESIRGWAPPVDIMSRYVEVLYRKGARNFRTGIGAGLPAEVDEFSAWLRAAGTPLMKQLGRSPRTLLHGDYRLDNLFFEGEGVASQVTAFDWQTVCQGPGALDIAYFISGNLAEDVAARCEMDLLATYHRLLLEGGVRDYDFDALLADYRVATCFVGYRMIAGGDMIDFSNERGAAMFGAWMRRLAALLPADYRDLVVVRR